MEALPKIGPKMTKPADPPTKRSLPKAAKPTPAVHKADHASRKRMQMTDIARLAGVSISTVSRALSGSDLIPETTRQRIAALARSLNYQVNAGAANLRKKDIQTVGVVMLSDEMQTPSDPFILSILGHVADALDARGMSLLLSRICPGRSSQMSAMVESGQVAGLIVIGQLTYHDELNALYARGIPMVVWGANLDDCLYPVVGSDNYLGGLLAGRHLAAQGCQRIAFVGDATHPETRLRFEGYRAALAEAALPFLPELHLPVQFGTTRTREAMRQWLDEGHRFDGIFTISDVTAITAMGVLSERGIKVPQEVKVVGYDDVAIAAHLHPGLSTVRQPIPQAGAALVDMLMQVIQGQRPNSTLLLTELIVRESSVDPV